MSLKEKEEIKEEAVSDTKILLEDGANDLDEYFLPKKMSKKKKILIAIFAFIFAVILAASGYFVYKNLFTPDTNQGSEQMVFLGSISSYIQGNGMTSANKKEELGKDLEGEVLEVLVKPGDEVLTGDLLLRVDPAVITEKLNEALDELSEANLDYDNSVERLNSLNVVAPFTGKVIETTDAEEGTQVSSETVYAVIVDDTKMTLSAYFSYGYIDAIKAGQAANVSIPATTSNLQGVVTSVENVKKISPTDGSVLFKVNIEISNPGTLTKDMIAAASIVTDLGEIFPAESSTLDYIKTQDIILKASGELVYKNVNDFYLYNAGDHLGTLENDSLINEVNSKKREVDSLLEKVTTLEKALVDTELRSPIDGIVSQISVAAEDIIAEGSDRALVTVSNLDSLYVDVKISEIDITKASIGMPATISYESTDGMYQVMGEITNLSLEAERDGDGFRGPITYFPAKITINDPQNLRPDMNIKYRIVADEKFDILVVPVSAVVQTEYGPSLYVKKGSVDGFETFKPIDESIPSDYEVLPVELGISDAYTSEIVTAIPDGTPIYVPNSSVTGPGGYGYGGYGYGMYGGYGYGAVSYYG